MGCRPLTYQSPRQVGSYVWDRSAQEGGFTQRSSDRCAAAQDLVSC